MIVDIINFSMTASASANYVLDIGFTVLLKAFLPVFCIGLIIKRGF
ncbi:hypothetical protein [Sulfurospirillum diekertiae]|uniref:Uncharacterized protein n=1 Tax=Sulfurospirillum diekertiae TaxID=1854492 RepID=A0A1Y0HMP7_9BACT|nr:hypothetical protein [Sulfurospirillum diekertiae]ARU49407.1 hypothetical protein Sdiek1_2255 [Sulfurospirillum diekertiae]ASC94214.1 hypothetical protein Sdiek2_2206 [Sulfurospirillum diekertiae]